MTKQTLLISTLLVLLSCSCRTIQRICMPNPSEYSRLSYNVLDKKMLDVIGIDTVYNGNIIISGISGDTLSGEDFLCYCLAICNTESMPQANFDWDSIAFNIVRKYNMQTPILNDLDKVSFSDERLFRQSFVCTVHIPKIDERWKSKLTSKNFDTGGFWYIGPIDGPYKKMELVIKKDGT